MPVTLNTDRLPDTEAGRFFRALMKRWPQGLWVVTPEGQTLGFHYHKPVGGDNYQQNQQRWIRDTLKILEVSWTAAGDVPLRDVKAQNPFPDRGFGLQKSGGVRLALSVIGLRVDRQEGPPAIDSFLLSADEWGSFAPKEAAEWTVSESAAKRFAPAFSPLTDSIFVPRPKDVTQAQLQAKIVREVEGLQVIRYSGEWRSAHDRDGNPKFPMQSQNRGEGIGVYDPRKKQIRSLVLLSKGTYQNSSSTTSTASIIEWVAE